MRKDMRLGLAVGGVLAIVVLAYAVLFSGGKDKYKKSSDNPSALGAGGGSSGGAGQASSGAAANPGRTQVGGSSNNSQLGFAGGTGAGATGQGSARTGQGGNGAGAGGAGVAGDTGAGGTPQQPRGWNWATALRNGSGGAVPHTETPDPNRTTQDNWRPREGSQGSAATRPSNPGESAQGRRPDGDRADNAQSTTGPKKRVVKAGESYWTIAKEEYGSAVYVSHLIRANPGINPKALKAGATITIPPRSEVIPDGVTERALGGGTDAPAQIDPARQYRVQAGDNLSVISRKLYGKTDKVDAIYELNKDVIGPNRSALKRDMVLVLPEPPTTTQRGTGAAVTSASNN